MSHGPRILRRALSTPARARIVRRRGYTLSFGASSARGARPTMEDAEFIGMSGNLAFAGVYDGHGGAGCSQFVSARLGPSLLARISDSERPGVAGRPYMRRIAGRARPAMLRLDGAFLADGAGTPVGAELGAPCFAFWSGCTASSRGVLVCLFACFFCCC
jgi:hypothetical protein